MHAKSQEYSSYMYYTVESFGEKAKIFHQTTNRVVGIHVSILWHFQILFFSPSMSDTVIPESAWFLQTEDCVLTKLSSIWYKSNLNFVLMKGSIWPTWMSRLYQLKIPTVLSEHSVSENIFRKTKSSRIHADSRAQPTRTWPPSWLTLSPMRAPRSRRSSTLRPTRGWRRRSTRLFPNLWCAQDQRHQNLGDWGGRRRPQPWPQAGSGQRPAAEGGHQH